MPFDDHNDSGEETRGPARKIGLKKTNSVSSSVGTAKDIKNNFESRAEEKFSKIEDYKTQIWDLSVKYKSFIENKVLAENKGPIASNLEKEVLEKLMQLASEMNADSTQDEGVGSNALCMLLMKCMLLQRDSINTMHFKIDQLVRKVAVLEKNLADK